MTKQSTITPEITIEDIAEFEKAVSSTALEATLRLANKSGDNSAAVVKCGVWLNGRLCRGFIESVQISGGSFSTVHIEILPDNANGEIFHCTVELKADRWVVNPFVRVEKL